MSTRSIIGTYTSDTTYTGLYCHFDGYPSGQIPALAAIITRDGKHGADVLTGKADHADGQRVSDWMSLCESVPSSTAPMPYPTYDAYMKAHPTWRDRTAGENLAYQTRDRSGTDYIIGGYGIAGTIKGDGLDRVAFGEMPLSGKGLSSFIEWVYLITDDLTVVVYENGDLFDTPGGTLVERGRFTVDVLRELSGMGVAAAVKDERLRIVECGKAFEHCSHVAGAHVPDAEDPDQSMKSWLATHTMAELPA